MVDFLVLEDFAGNIPLVAGGSRSYLPAGTIIDDTVINVPAARANGLPAILYDPATMATPLANFLAGPHGGAQQVATDGNLLAMLYAAGVVPAGSTVGPGNAVYVATAAAGGDDATGARGDAARPFASLAAALAVMQDGDQMRIGPGNYGVAAPLVPPAGVTRFSVIGSGRSVTRVAGPTAGGSILALGNAMVSFLITGIDFDASSAPGDSVLSVVGTGGGGATLADGGFIYDCSLRGGTIAVSGLSCGPITIVNCRLRDGALSTADGTIHTIDCATEDAIGITIAWNGGADAPPRQPARHSNLKGGGAVLLAGAPHVEFDETCVIGDVTSPAPLTDIGGVDGTPRVTIRGQFEDLTLILPDTLTACVVDLAGSRILGVTDIIVTGAAANFQGVNMDGVSIANQGPNRVIARAGIEIRIFSDEVFSAIFQTVGTGTITPSKWTGTVALAGAANLLAFGFTASAAPRSVVATADNLAAGALGVAKTAADVTVSPAVPGAFNADIIARWN